MAPKQPQWLVKAFQQTAVRPSVRQRRYRLCLQLVTDCYIVKPLIRRGLNASYYASARRFRSRPVSLFSHQAGVVIDEKDSKLNCAG